MDAYSDDGVKRERTWWRDAELSERHREWGFDCPVTDIDFLVLEYDRGKPSALVEYKKYTARIEWKSQSYRALKELANNSKIPFFLCRYWPNPLWWFEAYPMNDKANEILASKILLNEDEWITELYKLRANVRKISGIPLDSLRRNFIKVRNKLKFL